ncbi:NAD(P)/FAD-dependent oxidoreductase [Mesorhizobium sp. ZC-5]|uniref:NAD(P)/FAD-dependent oxidoreductase n=1 Tax=Mesorhizobium sp. ZC-5 TaxID=2986066 RepID=UPI0021E7D5D9|nr:NAD(P)/FAD-dependent oxidoreductase [Mesorhizobium sp. ZC-5]MCV3243540.1 NAD(P)/FAD-dependent oxidoreductase [Mesorhizobium sp. ZC-5]
MNYDVIVIGAGPAGSSTALALARQGWKVAIVEKAAFPRRKVCGEFMSATNLALLDKFGLGDAWRTEAGPEVRRVGLFAGNRNIEARMPPAPGGGYGRALGRDLLDTLFLAAAREAGAEVFQPWHAVDIAGEGTAQAVRIATGEEERLLSAPVIVAAHGSWEQGKLPSQLQKTSRPSDLFGFKAHFSDAHLTADLMPLFIFPGGYGGMVWSDHGRLSISCCIRRDVLAAVRGSHGGLPAGEAVFRHIAASCRGVAEAIRDDVVADGGWLAAGPIRPGVRPGYADDIFRVGNLAGESHPLIAEGISMAIQSGWLLAAELSGVDLGARSARANAGRRYSAAWRRQFWLRIVAAESFARAAAFPGAARIAWPLVGAVPGLLTLGARLSGKTRTPAGLGVNERPEPY